MFSLKNCNVIYYGKTKCDSLVAVGEHMDVSHLTYKGVKIVKQSTISNHLLTYEMHNAYN